jgi:hypothetical protein
MLSFFRDLKEHEEGRALVLWFSFDDG